MQLHARARARSSVIFRKDSDFYASLARCTLCVVLYGAQVGVLRLGSSQGNTLDVENGSVILAHSTEEPLSIGAAPFQKHSGHLDSKNVFFFYWLCVGAALGVLLMSGSDSGLNV